MIRDFVCLNCRKKFRADDTIDVLCPFCKFDNITILSGSNVKNVIVAFCFILFAAIGYFIPLGLYQDQNSEIATYVYDDYMYAEATMNSITHNNAMEEVDTTPIPRIINISTPTLRNGKYVFEVVAETKRGRYNYEIRQEPGSELISSNTNGKFEDIPYSESGMYRIEVINSSEPQYKDYIIITGFDKPVNELPAIAKLTSDDVEGGVNNKWFITSSDQFDDSLHDHGLVANLQVPSCSDNVSSTSKTLPTVNRRAIFHSDKGGVDEPEDLGNPYAREGDENLTQGDGGGLIAVDSDKFDEGLRGRGLVGNLPVPSYPGNASGKIVIRVAVNQHGQVTSAAYDPRSSTSSDAALIAAAIEAAKRARFTESRSFAQGGTITYNFRLN